MAQERAAVGDALVLTKPLGRPYIVVFAGIIGRYVVIGSVFPALFIVLPRFCGGAFAQFFNMTRHVSLAEIVWDSRLNTRTVHVNPVFAFPYKM